MKKLILGSVSMFIVTTLQAQMPSPAIDTANKKSQEVMYLNSTLLRQGSYSHSTSKGDVYILPYDNMPCLVPNMRQVAPMPGSIQRVPESRMPNATPRRELIPKQKNKNPH
jgi:hypothetical protein